MYVDKFHEFSDSQAVTATALSTNIIDLGPQGIGDMGNADLDIVFQVDTTTASAGATTLDIEVWTHSTTTVTSGVKRAEITGIAKATLVEGAQFNLKVPRDMLNSSDRYIGLNYTVNTANFSAGAFSAFMTGFGGVQQNIV